MAVAPLSRMARLAVARCGEAQLARPKNGWRPADAIRVLLGRAAAIPEQGRPLVAYDPTVISNASFWEAVIVCGFAKLVALGETQVASP